MPPSECQSNVGRPSLRGQCHSRAHVLSVIRKQAERVMEQPCEQGSSPGSALVPVQAPGPTSLHDDMLSGEMSPMLWVMAFYDSHGEQTERVITQSGGNDKHLVLEVRSRSSGPQRSG